MRKLKRLFKDKKGEIVCEGSTYHKALISKNDLDGILSGLKKLNGIKVKKEGGFFGLFADQFLIHKEGYVDIKTKKPATREIASFNIDRLHEFEGKIYSMEAKFYGDDFAVYFLLTKDHTYKLKHRI